MVVAAAPGAFGQIIFQIGVRPVQFDEPLQGRLGQQRAAQVGVHHHAAGGVNQRTQAGPGKLPGQFGGPQGHGLFRKPGFIHFFAVDDGPAQFIHCPAHGLEHQLPGHLGHHIPQFLAVHELVHLGQAGQKALVNH